MIWRWKRTLILSARAIAKLEKFPRTATEVSVENTSKRDYPNKCPHCRNGRVKYTIRYDTYGKHESTCPYCDGTGKESHA